MTQPTRDIVVIGASAGGVQAALQVASMLPADLPAAVFVAIHMAAGFVSRLPELMSARGPLRASHPVDGELIQRGRIYVAPPDNHLVVRNGYIHVVRGPKENGYRPSIDLMFRSASMAYGARVIGVVLTGNLDCGTGGLLSIRSRGGLAVVQDPADAEVPSMPASALNHVPAEHVVRLAELPALLSTLTREPAPAQMAHVPGALMEMEGEQLGIPASIVCPVCQGALTESQVEGFSMYRCHVGHAFSLGSMVAEQAESVERALWAAARALEEAADLSARLSQRSTTPLKLRFEEKELEQRRQAAVIKQLIASPQQLTVTDATAGIGGPETDTAQHEPAES